MIFRKISFLIIGYLFIGNAVGQTRYLNEIADSVQENTYTYTIKDGQDLKLDVYTPAFDSENQRMTMIYLHGGGFAAGDRSHGKDFCTHLARYGFTAVTMSYRLTRKKSGFGCDCPATDKQETFDAAKEDIMDAMYFLVQHREQLGIDPHKIILSGSSAGAEAVLYAAYQPPYCYGLESGPVSFAGVIGMAGAIPSLDKIYEDSAIPSMFFHGTCDNLVPYATAPHHYCKKNEPGYFILHGGYSIAEKLRSMGKPYWMVSICGGDHAWAGKPMKNNFDDILRFCYDFVLQGKKLQIHTILKDDSPKKCSDYEQFNFCNETEK